MRSDDKYFIQRCLDGDDTAFGFLVDKYKACVYALAYSKLRNFHNAEDVTQEAFIKAYRNLRTLRRWDDFSLWLHSITSNLCKMFVRGESRRMDNEFVEDQDPKIFDEFSLEAYHDKLTDESIHDILNSLPDMYQQVLTLYYLGGMNSMEIAKFLGIPPTTIRQRLSRARSQLNARFTLSTSVVNGKIYAIGGQIPGDIIVSTVEEYDPVTDTWTKKADMSTPRGYFSTSVVDGKIYAIGGYDNNLVGLPTVEEYDPVTDTWTKKADMPTPRAHFSTTAVNGKIYAVGGYANGQPAEFSVVEEYDPVKNKWTKKADIPTSRAFHSASTVDDKIYVIGGWRLGGVIPTVEEYDPIKDKWVKKADMPTARTRFCADAVNKKIYAIGGSGSLLIDQPGYFSTVEEYDPLTDNWVEKADMPTARYWMSSGEVNGKIYVIGGCTMNGTSPIMEDYDPGTSGQSINFKGKLPTTWGEMRTAMKR
jgi:RNA polymerase sigma factor (sigma-70 family)